MHFLLVGIKSIEYFSLAVIVIMAHKRDTSKDTTKSSISEAVDSMRVNLPLYIDTQLFVKKELDLTWQKVNESFSTKIFFEEDLED